MGSDSRSRCDLRPRVVILDRGDSVTVELVELPSSTEIGTEFGCRGGRWKVIARRPRTTVLIARLLQA